MRWLNGLAPPGSQNCIRFVSKATIPRNVIAFGGMLCCACTLTWSQISAGPVSSKSDYRSMKIAVTSTDKKEAKTAISKEDQVSSCAKKLGNQTEKTKKLCRKILSAYGDSILSADDLTGQVTVDFRNENIEAGFLKSILVGDAFLADQFHGGIVLRNFILRQPLILDHAVVTVPVILSDAVFGRSGSSKEELRLIDVISIKGSKIKKRFRISNSKTNGRVTIIGSDFQSELQFIKVNFISDLIIVGTKIEGNLYISNAKWMNSLNSPNSISFREVLVKGTVVVFGNSEFDIFELKNSSIENLVVIRTKFVRDFIFDNNKVGSVAISDSVFLRNILVQSNIITKNLHFQNISAEYDTGRLFRADENAENVAGLFYFVLSANIVGGGVFFYPGYLDCSYRRLDLSFNDVAGYSEIFLPARTDNPPHRRKIRPDSPVANVSTTYGADNSISPDRISARC